MSSHEHVTPAVYLATTVESGSANVHKDTCCAQSAPQDHTILSDFEPLAHTHTRLARQTTTQVTTRETRYAMTMPRIAKIEWARLEGTRPRHAGHNARLDAHGLTVRVPMVRLTTDDGATGYGRSLASEEQAAAIVGQPLDALFDPAHGTHSAGLAFDFPLWDLMAKRAGKPVYALAAEMAGVPTPRVLRVPCYDTSLYIDDLHLADDDEAAALIAQEAGEGQARGHRSFKIKVGRGARHMPLEDGTRRDVAVIRAVRKQVGPEATILIDANNGYNLNITKRVLSDTAESNVFWVEEPFHEDPVLYADLKAWIAAQGLPTLIADGEGLAAPLLQDWAQQGLVQVVQYDIFGYGFTPWLALGKRLDAWGVLTAPHHYGGHYGNYASGHLSPAIGNFAFVEWDEATTPGLDVSEYTIEDGAVVVPSSPGFGVTLDDDHFAAAVTAGGYARSA